MAYGCESESRPRAIELEDTEDMRSQGNMSDRLGVEVDCHSLGSNECPSMGSSFSPLESPTPTPTSIYSQGSLASPSWPENGSYPGHAYDRGTGSTPIRGHFRLASMPSHENMGLPPYSSLDGQDRMAVTDFLPSYDENADQFWLPSDVPKTYDHHVHGLPCPPSMHQYPPMLRSNYRHHPAPYFPESATNPCLSRPIFHHQPERLPPSLSMSHMMPWMGHTESIAPETIAPSQVAPVTPPPSYTDFSNSINTFKTHSPDTPIRSCSLGTVSGADTPLSRLSGGAGEYMDECHQSPLPRCVRRSSAAAAIPQDGAEAAFQAELVTREPAIHHQAGAVQVQRTWLQGSLQATGTPQAPHEEPLQGKASCLLGSWLPSSLFTQ